MVNIWCPLHNTMCSMGFCEALSCNPKNAIKSKNNKTNIAFETDLFWAAIHLENFRRKYRTEFVEVKQRGETKVARKYLSNKYFFDILSFIVVVPFVSKGRKIKCFLIVSMEPWMMQKKKFIRDTRRWMWNVFPIGLANQVNGCELWIVDEAKKICEFI